MRDVYGDARRLHKSLHDCQPLRSATFRMLLIFILVFLCFDKVLLFSIEARAKVS